MPWSIEERDGKFCVIKEADGANEGCHDTREEAERQRRALYASEDEMAAAGGAIVNPDWYGRIGDVPSAQPSTLGAMTSGSGTTLPIFDGDTLVGWMLPQQPWTATVATSGTGVTQITASVAEAEEEVVDENAPLVPWRALLTLERSPSDDGRIFMDWDWRDLPLDLMAQFENEEGHMGAELAGRIDRIWKQPLEEVGLMGIWGEGVFNREEAGRKALRLRRDGMLRGVSVDYAPSGRIGLVDPETLEFVDESEVSMEEMLFGGNYLFGAEKATIAMATMVGFPAFHEANLTLLASAGSSVFISRGIEIVDHEYDVVLEEKPAVLTASAAGAAPLKPPSAWFERLEANEPTPLTVTAEGHVYGHLALWNQCHPAFEACQLAPRSKSGYKWFHLGEIETEEGDVVSVGRITVEKAGSAKGGHASIVLGTQGAIDHYDRTGCVAAFVRAVDGRHGIWLSGAVRSDAPAERVRDMRANPPSGDWRWEDGSLELVGVLSVPVPGFPIPRLVASVAYEGEDEQVLAMVASGYTTEPIGPKAARREMRMLRRELDGTDDWR